MSYSVGGELVAIPTCVVAIHNKQIFPMFFCDRFRPLLSEQGCELPKSCFVGRALRRIVCHINYLPLGSQKEGA